MTQTEPAELTVEQWKRRALRAEGAVRHALWMRPTSHRNETATEMADRFRQHIEAVYPDLIVRYQHQPIEVFKWADACGCKDDGSSQYENDHSESGEDGEALCSRSFLGYVCETCRDDEDCNGPEWKPEAVLWPCPPIAAVNAATDIVALRAALAVCTSAVTSSEG